MGGNFLDAARADIMAGRVGRLIRTKVDDNVTTAGLPLKGGDKGLWLFYVIRLDWPRTHQNMLWPAGR
jgi:hypothetical protein